MDSLIPLLYNAHDRDVQAAVDHATKIVRDSVKKFNLAADALLEHNADDQELKADLTRFIDSCRYACTGNLDWR